MNTAARVDLIRRLRAALENIEWSERMMILRQFRAHVPGPAFEESNAEYLLRCLEEGDDASLVALAEYLLHQPRPTAPDSPLWAPNYLRLFLSHIHQQRRFAAEVKLRLFLHGIDAFVAHQDLEPTTEWMRSIEEALQTCDALAAFLTPEFPASKWTDQECGFALARGVTIVPVSFGLMPYGFVGRFQAMEGQDRNSETVAWNLFILLSKNDGTKSKLAESVVAMLERANTFADAKRIMTSLEAFDSAPTDLVERVSTAPDRNDQVRDAFGVPKRIRQWAERILREG